MKRTQEIYPFDPLTDFPKLYRLFRRLPAVTFFLTAFIAFNFAFAQEKPKLKIVTSFYPVYIIAKNVTQDVPGVDLENLTPAVTGCLHDYALSAADMKKLVDAQVFVANGAGMESFLEKILSQYPKIKVVELAQNIPLIKSVDNPQGNPHVWVSVTNAIIEVKNLGLALAAIDPEHQARYQQNAAGYVNRLKALRAEMQAKLAPYIGRDIITFHEAFPYFAREFGLNIAAVIEREPGASPSAQELARTIDLVKKTGIKALFGEPQYPAQAAQVIAQETGANMYVLDPAVTGPDRNDAYIKIMERNLGTLKEALNNEAR